MKRLHDGFTIVECVLALGIASSVLLVTIALLPAGMDAVRDATHRTTEAAIIQRIRQQFVSTQVLPADDLYFDHDGAALSGWTDDAAFAVRVEQVAGAQLPGDAEPSMRRIRIRITISDRAQRAPFADVRRLRTYHLLLAPAQPGGKQ